MARGGHRPGAGRKRGSKTQKTSDIALKAAAEGISPLEYMLQVMREPEPVRLDDEDSAAFLARYVGWRDRAFEAAKASAPYCHPKLANIEHTGKDGGAIQSRVTVEFVGKAP